MQLSLGTWRVPSLILSIAPHPITNGNTGVLVSATEFPPTPPKILGSR
jgi:hypothetical protein